MAENKKSFVAYCDWKATFDALPDAEAGMLVKHLFAYVNDENPVTENVLINAVFANIKMQLKRDLRKYEEFIEKQSLNGKRGGRPTKAKETQKTQAFFKKPKKADNDNDNVTDNVNDINNKKNAVAFSPPEIQDVLIYFEQNGYSGGERFYHSYSVNDWIDSHGNKIKNWKQKAQMVWFKPENKITEQRPYSPHQPAPR